MALGGFEVTETAVARWRRNSSGTHRASRPVDPEVVGRLGDRTVALGEPRTRARFVVGYDFERMRSESRQHRLRQFIAVVSENRDYLVVLRRIGHRCDVSVVQGSCAR